MLCHSRGEEAAEKTQGRLDAKDRLTEMGYVSAAFYQALAKTASVRLVVRECHLASCNVPEFDGHGMYALEKNERI